MEVQKKRLTISKANQTKFKYPTTSGYIKVTGLKSYCVKNNAISQWDCPFKSTQLVRTAVLYKYEQFQKNVFNYLYTADGTVKNTWSGPRVQYLVMRSTRVSGIVKAHSKMSDTARFAIKMFLVVNITWNIREAPLYRISLTSLHYSYNSVTTTIQSRSGITVNSRDHIFTKWL